MAAMVSAAMDVIFRVDCSCTAPGLRPGEYFFPQLPYLQTSASNVEKQRLVGRCNPYLSISRKNAR